jgi:hypothetical protein
MLTRVSWPSLPYKGLNFYGADDRPLFCERDVEVAECASLLAHFETKLLLLHGRTGTGKSSFIRAGLFPAFIEHDPGFVYVSDVDGHGALLVRSTANPLVATADMLRTHLASDPTLGQLLRAPTRTRVIEMLNWRDNVSPAQLADVLMSALKRITFELPGTLVLAVDQGEEVFTLGDSEGEDVRNAYFAFLEKLCFEQFDIKILLVIRTEYYGQFSDRFRLGPDLTVSTAKSGLTQFMLHGIKEPERLVEAIVRPTRREPVGGLLAPFDAYGFSFEPGLPEHIAADVLRHCGESSTLPVLQLVCLDLYQTVPRTGARVITLAAYEASGRIDGAIDRFIEHGIDASVKAATGSGASPADMSSWKELLSTLVARQEGGALTSLLVPASELTERASASSLAHAEKCFKAMAHESVRLLRIVSVSDAQTGRQHPHFSLGHDSLAPALFSFRESWQVVRKARASASRRVRNVGIATALLAVVAISFGLQSGTAERVSAASIVRYTDLEPQVRLKLLTLLSATDRAGSIYRWLGLTTALTDNVSRMLPRAPVDVFEASAAGVDRDGTRLAAFIAPTVGASGRVVVMTSSGEVQPGELDVPMPKDTGFMLGVGFLDGLQNPAVFQNGELTVWSSGASTPVPTTRPVDITLPSPTFPEINAGVLRLTHFSGPGNGATLTFADRAWNADKGDSQAVSPAPVVLTLSQHNAWPVFSDNADLFAEIEPPNSSQQAVKVGRRSDPQGAKSIPLPEPMSSSRVFSTPFPEPGALDAPVGKSLAFVAGESTLVVRLSERHFVLLPNPLDDAKEGGVARAVFDIPNNATAGSLRPVRPQFSQLRPLLAVARHGAVYRFAWVTEQGVAIYEAAADGQMVPLDGPNPLLVSSASPESGSKLVFSRDGEHLFLTLYGGGKVNVRIWDLSDARLKHLRSLKLDEYRDEVCTLLARNPVGPSKRQLLTKEELERYPEFGGRQVCDR